MKHEPSVTLKPGREKSLLGRHPWVFSGAIKGVSSGIPDGSWVTVLSSAGDNLGRGYFNSRSGIRVRMVEFGEHADLAEKDVVRARFRQAIAARRALPLPETDCYRLINGESDNLPGVIVDQYGSVVVIQIGSLGFDRQVPFLIEILREELAPKTILNRSNLPSRAEEGLSPSEGLLWGEEVSQLTVQEYGLKLVVDFSNAQKTGMFLDHRESRRLVGELSAGRRVLNCFSFSGGFSLHALRGGARHVTSVDTDKKSLELLAQQIQRNDLLPERSQVVSEDVFDFLDREVAQADERLARGESPEGWDLIVLDPPAFAKRAEHVNQAAKGYKRLLMQAMKLVTPNGLILTCSCSAHVDENLFGQLIFQVARDLKRQMRVLQRHRAAFDHGVSVFYPEGNYLKSFLLQIQ